MATAPVHHICVGQGAALRPCAPARSTRTTRCIVAQHSRLQHTSRASSNSSSSSTLNHGLEQVQHAVKAPSTQHIVQKSMLLSIAALLATGGAAHAAVSGAGMELYNLADLDAAAAHTLETILRPLFTVFTLLYIIRIPMTWYPSIDGTKLPWLLAYAPTEPVLKVTRNVIPLVGGVDITPIVWVGLISFFNEILLGPQGILLLIQRESGVL